MSFSAHKMELLDETYRLNRHLHKAQNELQKQGEAMSSTSYHFMRAQQKLAGVVDAHLSTFQNFDEAVRVGWCCELCESYSLVKQVFVK